MLRCRSLRALTTRLIVPLLLAVPASVPAGALRSENPRVPEPVAGELILQLAPEAAPATPHRFAPGAEIRTGRADIDARLASIGAFALEPVFDLGTDPAAKRAIGLDRVYRVRFRGAMTPAQAAQRFAGARDVAHAEPHGRRVIQLTPNDPTFSSQWAHANTGQAVSFGGGLVGTPDCDTDTPAAWDLETGSPSLILAIIDTGVDLGHPEFAGRVVPGWDFVNDDADASDDNGHGTSCAGIALAAGNNGQGVAGVAWGVRLMPVKVFEFDGYATDEDVANGITFAADNGARILSMSFGGASSLPLNLALDYAVNTKGCAAFAAAGNAGAPMLDYPAAYTTCIAVGALSPCNERKNPASCDGESWWGSNHGVGLQFLAPGTRIHTTDIRGAGGYDPGDYFATFNGTSSATPHAAGIGALVWSRAPQLTRSQMWNALIGGCDNLGGPGWDSETGYGRLNAYNSIQLAAATPVTIFAEGFETGSVPGGTWSASDANATSGLDYWGAQTAASGARVHGGAASAYCAHNASPAGQSYDRDMNADMTLISAINLAGYLDPKITFWKWFKTAHSNDYLSFQQWNGSAWVERQRWTTSDETWRSHTYSITGLTSYRFRFVFFSNNSKNSEGAYIDDIALTGIPGGSLIASRDGEFALGGPDGADLAVAGDGDPVASPAVESAGAPRRTLAAMGNPFRGGTSLAFTLPRAGSARLAVYSITGAHVATLAEGPLASGAHLASWTGADAAGRRCAPGVYFARLAMEGRALATERLVLLP